MFYLRLFGYFRLDKDGKSIDEGSLRSPMLMKLLIYLIQNRDRVISHTEIEKYLWHQGKIENPTDALKNLICRLRNILAKNFGQRDYIITGRGNYGWNPAYEVVVDADEFHADYLQCKNAILQDREKEEILNHAISLYTGMFLTNMEDDYWANNQSMIFHSIYMYLVKELYTLYWKAERYAAIEILCSKALAIDEFDENFNLYKVRALIKENKFGLAEKHYYAVEKNIKNNFGMKGTALLRSIKREMSDIQKGGLVTTESMQKEIKEHLIVGNKGSYRCEYDEFKLLYALQAKRNMRRKEEGYTILFTTYINEQETSGATEVQDFFIHYVMEGLEKILSNSLREFDVFTQCSDRQLMVMLDKCSYENSLKVANRIINKYNKEHDTKFADIKINIQKISI